MPSRGERDRPTAGQARSGTRAVLTPRELAELDNLADLRVSATAGEGFGVLTIEAMACGTPTLITDYTTSRELILGSVERGPQIPHWARAQPDRSGSPVIRNPQSAIHHSLDPFGPAGELIRVAAWTIESRRHLLRPILDAADLAARITALRSDPGRLARYAEAGLRRVLASYTAEHAARAWVTLARSVLGRARELA